MLLSSLFGCVGPFPLQKGGSAEALGGLGREVGRGSGAHS